MPIYQYVCEDCEIEVEEIKSVAEMDECPNCEKCNKVMRKQIFTTGIWLKGKGWFRDGYGKSNT